MYITINCYIYILIYMYFFKATDRLNVTNAMN